MTWRHSPPAWQSPSKSRARTRSPTSSPSADPATPRARAEVKAPAPVLAQARARVQMAALMAVGPAILWMPRPAMRSERACSTFGVSILPRSLRTSTPRQPQAHCATHRAIHSRMPLPPCLPVPSLGLSLNLSLPTSLSQPLSPNLSLPTSLSQPLSPNLSFNLSVLSFSVVGGGLVEHSPRAHAHRKSPPRIGVGICEWSPDSRHLAIRNDNMPAVVWVFETVTMEIKAVLGTHTLCSCAIHVARVVLCVCPCVRVCVCLCVCVEWGGVEWSGVEWSGVEWSGVLCGSWRLHVPPPHARMPATPQYTRTLSEPSSGALREHDWP